MGVCSPAGVAAAKRRDRSSRDGRAAFPLARCRSRFGGPLNRSPSQLAPGTWAPARLLAERVLGPLERFLHVEAASGIVLLLASVVALAWANSPWGHVYEHLWHVPITFGAGSLVFTQPLHFWINEGLMTIFFFVVG